MLSNIIIRSTAAFGGTPFRLNKCTALGSAGKGAAAGGVGAGDGDGHFRPDSTICYSASAFACDTADFAARAGDGHIRSDSTTCYGIFRFIRCSL